MDELDGGALYKLGIRIRQSTFDDMALKRAMGEGGQVGLGHCLMQEQGAGPWVWASFPARPRGYRI